MKPVFADTFFLLTYLVMRDEGLTQALTADQHFEQAGFTALLR
jgi:predicted nucleic acid-binding protein